MRLRAAAPSSGRPDAQRPGARRSVFARSRRPFSFRRHAFWAWRLASFTGASGDSINGAGIARSGCSTSSGGGGCSSASCSCDPSGLAGRHERHIDRVEQRDRGHERDPCDKDVDGDDRQPSRRAATTAASRAGKRPPRLRKKIASSCSFWPLLSPARRCSTLLSVYFPSISERSAETLPRASHLGARARRS